MLRLSALLVLAQGARQAAAARVQVNASVFEGADLACYCKEVESMEKCPDNKYRYQPERSDGPRYFHAGAQGENNLCCKLEETSMLDFIAYTYTKQDTPDRCNREVRVLPEVKCCRLQGSRGSIGVRVRSAQSVPRTAVAHGAPRFFKSPPFVQLEDIVSAEDYDGAQVHPDQLRAFLEVRHLTGNLECGGSQGTMEALFADKREDCLLRETTTRDCCCNEASLTRATRCLPAEGAATEEQAAPLYLDANVEPTTENGYIKDVLTFASPPREADMPELMELADPEQQDLPETPADEAAMLFSWERTQQWSVSCSHWGDIRTVNTWKTTRKVPNGENCVMARVGKITTRRCTKKYKTVTDTHHSQGKEEVCVQKKWVRDCPAGQGQYSKKIHPGTCMGEETGLQQVAPLSYVCPAGHRSRHDEERSGIAQCECRSDCS